MRFFSFVLSLLVLSCFPSNAFTNAWVPIVIKETETRFVSNVRSSTFKRSLPFPRFSTSARIFAKNNEEEDTPPVPDVQWGVSYIGGDPCGSKYNSDPFDKKPSDKPGLPDDMKARIEALAKKKLQEEQERQQ